MPKYIYVPQGCYAEIIQNTPEDVIGLCTANIISCTHIIIKNQETGYIALFHADALNDLNHPEHGIRFFIEKAKSANTSIIIDIGETEEKPRYEPIPDFFNIIDPIIAEYKQNGVNIELTTHCVDKTEYGISISRNGIIEEEENDPTIMKGAIIGRANGLTIIEPPFITVRDTERIEPFGTAMLSAQQRIQNRWHEEHGADAAINIRFPMICVFDGTEDTCRTVDKMREAQPDSEFNWDRVADGLDTASSTERGSDHSDESVAFSHLLRSEKKALLQRKPKFINILSEGLSEEEKDKIINMKKLSNSQENQFDIEHHELRFMNADPKITLMQESDHKLDHRKNAQTLIQMIDDRKIDGRTVICLERKEYGTNFGMQDVRLLANLIKYNQNNPDTTISIPAKIQNSLIYQDAMLYNSAKQHGIKIIGIEGKELQHNKESPEYNSTRENHMAKCIEQISAAGRNVIFPVGAAHVNGLKARLPLAKIAQDIEVSNSKIKLDLVVSQIREGLEKSQISTSFKNIKNSSSNYKSFSR